MMIVGLAGTADASCSTEVAKRIFDEFGHDNHYLRHIKGADHLYYTWVTGDSWNNILIESIELGHTTKACEDTCLAVGSTKNHTPT